MRLLIQDLAVDVLELATTLPSHSTVISLTPLPEWNLEECLSRFWHRADVRGTTLLCVCVCVSASQAEGEEVRFPRSELTEPLKRAELG